MLDVSSSVFSAEYGREGSLNARLIQEDNEISRICQKPIFGWGNWSSGQDQLWLLLARNTGLPTIAAWLATFSLPLLLVLMANLKQQRELLIYGVPLGLVLAGWLIDGLFNGMFNPMWPVCAAAMMTAATANIAVTTESEEEVLIDSEDGAELVELHH